jgi:hypothetical protein
LPRRGGSSGKRTRRTVRRIRDALANDGYGTIALTGLASLDPSPNVSVSGMHPNDALAVRLAGVPVLDFSTVSDADAYRIALRGAIAQVGTPDEPGRAFDSFGSYEYVNWRVIAREIIRCGGTVHNWTPVFS